MVAIVALVFFGFIPNRTKVAIDKTRKHEGDRFSTSLHLVRIDNGSIIPGARGNTMPQAAQQLTREKIDDVRAKRRAAIHRRQILVASLLVVAAATLVCAFVFHFTALWALIPVALVAIVLFFGSRAAKVARAWEDSVKTVPQNSRPGAGSQVAPSSKSGGGNGGSHDSLGASPDPEILESAPTYVIPVDDVREVLRKQAIEKAAAISRHHAAQHEHSAQSVGVESVGAEKDGATQTVNAEGASEATEARTAMETASSAVAAAKSDNPAAVILHSAAVPSGNEKPVRVENDTKENGEKDLISFSLGTDTPVTDAPVKDTAVKTTLVKAAEATNAGGKAAVVKAQAVESAEITSYRQVAQAQPLPPAQQAEIFADVTPSDVSLDKVAVPAQSEDSLGVDIDAVIARRQS